MHICTIYLFTFIILIDSMLFLRLSLKTASCTTQSRFNKKFKMPANQPVLL